MLAFIFVANKYLHMYIDKTIQISDNRTSKLRLVFNITPHRACVLMMQDCASTYMVMFRSKYSDLSREDMIDSLNN